MLLAGTEDALGDHVSRGARVAWSTHFDRLRVAERALDDQGCAPDVLPVIKEIAGEQLGAAWLGAEAAGRGAETRWGIGREYGLEQPDLGVDQVIEELDVMILLIVDEILYVAEYFVEEQRLPVDLVIDELLLAIVAMVNEFMLVRGRLVEGLSAAAEGREGDQTTQGQGAQTTHGAPYPDTAR